MIGLYDYRARFYDPYLNRWLQPDSIVPDPYNPLDWDRYSYVRNNPVNNTDPTGHFTDGEIRRYLKETYGEEDYEAYYRAWKGDKLFWEMLRAAQYGDILYAPESGLSSLAFTKSGNTFGTEGKNGLYQYQGNGPYRLLYDLDSNSGASYRDLAFEDYYSSNGTATTPFIQFNLDYSDGYLQPQYDYSSGAPVYQGSVRWVTYGRKLDPNPSSGSGIPYLVSQGGKAIGGNKGPWGGTFMKGLNVITLLYYLNNGPLRCQVTISSIVINEAEFTPVMGNPKNLPHKR